MIHAIDLLQESRTLKGQSLIFAKTEKGIKPLSCNYGASVVRDLWKIAGTNGDPLENHEAVL